MRKPAKIILCLALVLAAAAALAPAAGLMASEGAAEGGYDIKHWKDFGFRVMNFAVFFAILFFLLKKPIREFFRGRTEGIARTMEYLETQAKNLEEQNNVMKTRLAQIAAEREGILAQYERDGAKERDRIIAEAKRAAEQIVRKAQVAAEQEVAAARRTLSKETGLLAVGIAGDILSKNVTGQDKSILMNDFVKEITRLPARG
ncbi:MAG: ATP synthase F0 subunit B [Deltaproteobacteria bacterium]|jgi:F-type H+-transporting ATPase subunit b|nr:ATP synthase F0 subunit B [Deltaproteobacteria bacterium]